MTWGPGQGIRGEATRDDQATVLLCQAVNIHCAIVVRGVDLATVGDGRIEFVEEERDVPLLRVPEDLDCMAAVGVGNEVVRIVDKEAAVGNGGVGVAVRDSAEK